MNMKTLTTIAKSNNLKYRQLRNKLLDLNIIYKNKKRYVPTQLALEKGITKESGRYGNEMVLSINYNFDEQKIIDHYRDNIGLEIDSTLPF